MPPEPEAARERWICATVVFCLVVLTAWLRGPGFSQGGFASHDVAGMLYNGMVLDRGGFPYVDTVELKAPGTFYLAWVFAGDQARDIGRFQVWANGWALAAMVATAVAAWRWFGPRAAVFAAIVYGVHDAHLDSMDANYVTWANLPAVLAASTGLGALLEARKSDGGSDPVARRRCVALWLAAGVLAGLATLAKRPSGVLLLVLVVWAAGEGLTTRRRLRASASRRRSGTLGWVLAIVVGFGLAHVPIAVHYASHGQLGGLVDGYVFNRWGADYVARGGATQLGLRAQLKEGLLATTFFLGPALLLAAFAVGRSEPRHWAQAWPLAVWSVLTLASAWVGFRFYKGYFLLPAAPLAVLAAAPWGLAGRLRAATDPPAPGRWPTRVVGVALGVALAVAGLRQAALLASLRHDRARVHDRGGRIIAEHVLAHSDADDQVWVWGWHLWDVYPLAGRMSGSRIYKSIGLLTPPNDDTWRRPSSRARFVEGQASRLLLADLERSRPRWIVFGSTVPWREFDELQTFLRTHYRRDRRVVLGRVRFYERVERPDTEPQPPWRPGQHEAPFGVRDRDRSRPRGEAHR